MIRIFNTVLCIQEKIYLKLLLSSRKTTHDIDTIQFRHFHAPKFEVKDICKDNRKWFLIFEMNLVTHKQYKF